MFLGYEDCFYYVEFSFDGKCIFIAVGIGIYLEYDEYYWLSDKMVCLWDVNIGKEFMVLRGYDVLVNYVVFSFNG